LKPLVVLKIKKIELAKLGKARNLFAKRKKDMQDINLGLVLRMRKGKKENRKMKLYLRLKWWFGWSLEKNK